uniref:Peptidase M12A domain-containing protein n=1 Tax=Ascaris lumbricoides TaxID=6252 RepID=A0A0M3IBG9_ASCLU
MLNTGEDFHNMQHYSSGCVNRVEYSHTDIYTTPNKRGSIMDFLLKALNVDTGFSDRC